MKPYMPENKKVPHIYRSERPKTPKRHRAGGGAARGEGKRLCRESGESN